MNHMKDVAQLLGVELGEEFKIVNSDVKHRLNDVGLQYLDDFRGQWINCHDRLFNLLNGTYEIVKLPILDDVEKRYLSRVIRPWRDKVEYIRKINFDDEDEFIVIIYRERESKAMPLPCFKKGTMYKGMEVGKEYSLEELNI